MFFVNLVVICVDLKYSRETYIRKLMYCSLKFNCCFNERMLRRNLTDDVKRSNLCVLTLPSHALFLL